MWKGFGVSFCFGFIVANSFQILKSHLWVWTNQKVLSIFQGVLFLLKPFSPVLPRKMQLFVSIKLYPSNVYICYLPEIWRINSTKPEITFQAFRVCHNCHPLAPTHIPLHVTWYILTSKMLFLQANWKDCKETGDTFLVLDILSWGLCGLQDGIICSCTT